MSIRSCGSRWRRSVHAIVGRHHRPGFGRFHHVFEGGQIDLAQGPRVGLDADGHAAFFLVVGRIVLQRGADAFALQPLDVGRAQAAGQERVLRIGLEIAAPERRAHDVDGRRQHHARAQRQRLAADRGGHFACQIDVPGRGEGHADREHRRRFAHVRAHPGRPVGDVDPGHAQPLDALQGEGCGARHQGDLLFQRQARSQIRGARFERACGVQIRRLLGGRGHEPAPAFADLGLKMGRLTAARQLSEPAFADSTPMAMMVGRRRSGGGGVCDA